MEEALAVAALGGALDRPVKSYSHGMRQRLGIAQAMLGMPAVLILDEPTNGLDPPQIAGLRPILQRYAASGRTVVVSSHLLAEVGMTCSHVVVMHAGRVVAAGAVGDLGVAGRTQSRGRLPRDDRRDRAAPGRAGCGRDGRSSHRAVAAGAPAMSLDFGRPVVTAYRALPWRAEARRQIRRPRTMWAFGILVALPVIVVASFALGDGGDPGGSRFSDLATSGAANFAVFMLLVAAELLILVLMALFVGDSVPAEASWGSLRYLLTAPVGRARLLTAKLVVGLATGAVALVIFVLWSLLVGGLAYGWSPLTIPPRGRWGARLATRAHGCVHAFRPSTSRD